MDKSKDLDPSVINTRQNLLFTSEQHQVLLFGDRFMCLLILTSVFYMCIAVSSESWSGSGSLPQRSTDRWQQDLPSSDPSGRLQGLEPWWPCLTASTHVSVAPTYLFLSWFYTATGVLLGWKWTDLHDCNLALAATFSSVFISQLTDHKHCHLHLSCSVSSD